MEYLGYLVLLGFALEAGVVTLLALRETGQQRFRADVWVTRAELLQRRNTKLAAALCRLHDNVLPRPEWPLEERLKERDYIRDVLKDVEVK